MARARALPTACAGSSPVWCRKGRYPLDLAPAWSRRAAPTSAGPGLALLAGCRGEPYRSKLLIFCDTMGGDQERRTGPAGPTRPNAGELRSGGGVQGPSPACRGFVLVIGDDGGQRGDPQVGGWFAGRGQIGRAHV